MSNIEQTRALLKTASEHLRTAEDVIRQLVDRVQGLEHQNKAYEIAVKTASIGTTPVSDLAEKVAELVQKSSDDLALEEKLASSVGGVGHQLHRGQQGGEGNTSAMSFLSA